MQKVKTSQLEAFSENDRGSTYEVFSRANEGYILAYRKAGSVSGNHWHEGKSEGKNPEVLLLLSGEIELEAKDLDTGETMLAQISAPVRIEIASMVHHTLRAISDCSFLEFNSLEEHKRDTKYPDS